MSSPEVLLRVLLQLPVFREDASDLERKRAQLALFASALSELPRPPDGISRRKWETLLIAKAEGETHFSIRIQEGRCLPFECDRGKARGPWQVHENDFTRADWDQMVGIENTAVETRAADRLLRASFYICRSNGDFPASTLSAFAGARCEGDYAKKAQELRRYNQILRSFQHVQTGM